MPEQNPRLILQPERERSLLRRHPWVFSGAIAESQGEPGMGATIDVLANTGEFLARAAYSPHSQIRARAWSFDPEEIVDADFLRRRLERAIASRAPYRTQTDALRLVHAESDGLPGLIVDQYGDTLVVQFLSAGPELWRETLIDLLLELTGLTTIYERSDADVRSLEGLEPRTGVQRGTLAQTTIQITEHEMAFKVDIATGHKTGFYLDQRGNRLRVRELAAGRELLDAFSYTGGFAANALRGEAAKVTLIDDSAEALALARENLALNGLAAEKAEFLDGDVFKLLRLFRDQGRSFDMVVLDPPKFAQTRAQAERAARGYKDINLLAFKLLRPGGLLATFSCSGGVEADLFQKIVAGAALDAGVDARILERLSQGPDHPVALNFPEGAYLKGLVCEVG